MKYYPTDGSYQDKQVLNKPHIFRTHGGNGFFAIGSVGRRGFYKGLAKNRKRIVLHSYETVFSRINPPFELNGQVYIFARNLSGWRIYDGGMLPLTGYYNEFLRINMNLRKFVISTGYFSQHYCIGIRNGADWLLKLSPGNSEVLKIGRIDEFELMDTRFIELGLSDFYIMVSPGGNLKFHKTGGEFIASADNFYPLQSVLGRNEYLLEKEDGMRLVIDSAGNRLGYIKSAELALVQEYFKTSRRHFYANLIFRQRYFLKGINSDFFYPENLRGKPWRRR